MCIRDRQVWGLVWWIPVGSGLLNGSGILTHRLLGAMDEEHVKDMLADRGVIRNRRKIEAVIENARLLLDVVAEHGGFHEYVRFLGADEDPEGAADELSGRFHHLGRTSSLFFLFSAGWRDLSNDAEEVEVDQAS